MAIKNLEYIGHVAKFYLPTIKLTQQIEPYYSSYQQKIHDFLIHNFEAYTVHEGMISGYWKNGICLIRDEHKCYEVSFNGKENVQKLVNFLVEIKDLMKEESIYLTMGYKSWLVK